jgi:hypothetical protein
VAASAAGAVARVSVVGDSGCGVVVSSPAPPPSRSGASLPPAHETKARVAARRPGTSRQIEDGLTKLPPSGRTEQAHFAPRERTDALRHARGLFADARQLGLQPFALLLEPQVAGAAQMLLRGDGALGGSRVRRRFRSAGRRAPVRRGDFTVGVSVDTFSSASSAA